MTWQLAPGELQEIFSLTPPERHGLCVQLAVDAEEVWSLRQPDGWVLLSDRGSDAFPLWPHPDFAAACAVGDWAGAAAAAIELEELLHDLLPLLEEDGIAVAVFPAPDGRGVVVTPARFHRELAAEIELGQPG